MRAQITVTLNLEADTMTPELRLALDNLAAVMAVQAEDGVYLSGNPDDDTAIANDEPVENRLVSHLTIVGTHVQA